MYVQRHESGIVGLGLDHLQKPLSVWVDCIRTDA